MNPTGGEGDGTEELLRPVGAGHGGGLLRCRWRPRQSAKLISYPCLSEILIQKTCLKIIMNNQQSVTLRLPLKAKVAHVSELLTLRPIRLLSSFFCRDRVILGRCRRLVQQRAADDGSPRPRFDEIAGATRVPWTRRSPGFAPSSLSSRNGRSARQFGA